MLLEVFVMILAGSAFLAIILWTGRDRAKAARRAARRPIGALTWPYEAFDLLEQKRDGRARQAAMHSKGRHNDGI